MFGSAAAKRLNEQLIGHSIHRRCVRVDNKLVDGHLRVTNMTIQESQMDPMYLQNLGCELANVANEVYTEFIRLLVNSLDQLDADETFTKFGTCPMLLDGNNCPSVFKDVRVSLLFSILRNMMCKLSSFCIGHVVTGYIDFFRSNEM